MISTVDRGIPTFSSASTLLPTTSNDEGRESSLPDWPHGLISHDAFIPEQANLFSIAPFALREATPIALQIKVSHSPEAIQLTSEIVFQAFISKQSRA